jgi:simple sugar transport system permease protein
LFQNNILVYLAFALVLVTWFVMERTTFGLRIKMVGEHPRAADAKGINVRLIRNLAVIIGGAYAGAAGAYMSTAYMNLFTDNLVSGQGYMAVAVVIFAKFRPLWAMVGSFVFVLANALQMRLQAIGVEVPNQIMLMLPYIVTIFALVSTSRKAQMPSAYTKPFVRMER